MDFNQIKELFDNKQIKMTKIRFNKSVNNIWFLLINKDDDFQEEYKSGIQKSNFIIIHKINEYFIFCYDDQLLIIPYSYQNILKKLFDFELIEDKFFFLSDSREKFIDIFPFKVGKKNDISILREEISAFEKSFGIVSSNKKIIDIWLKIKPSLSAYFI